MTKIYKKDLINLITDKKRETLRKIELENIKAVEERKKEILEEQGVSDDIEKLQKSINSIYDDALELINELALNKAINYDKGRWCSPEKELHELVNDQIASHIKMASEFNDTELTKTKNHFKKVKEETKNTYDNVLAIVKKQTNVKKAAQYVESIGFNLDDIKYNDDVTDLMPIIDVAKLYLNKLNE